MREGSSWRPSWMLAAEYMGMPAVKIFVPDMTFAGMRLDRNVLKHPDGFYAAYRNGADEPFLLAKDFNEAFGIAS